MKYIVLFLLLPILFACKKEYHVAAVIIDSSTRQPVPNVAVQPFRPSRKGNIYSRPSVHSAPDGRFELSVWEFKIEHDGVLLYVRKEGYLAKEHVCHASKLNDTIILVRAH